VPARRAPELLAALHSAGYPAAAVIGRVVPRESASSLAPLVYLKKKQQ
jgi:hydrogenase maturation factor